MKDKAQEGYAFFLQAMADYIQTLPPAAKQATGRMAQQAGEAIEQFFEAAEVPQKLVSTETSYLPPEAP